MNKIRTEKTTHTQERGSILRHKTIAANLFFVLLASIFITAVNIQTVKAEIVIDSDFVFTEALYEPIVVIADNIVIDGNGYTLHGTEGEWGIILQGVSNVVVKNLRITGWDIGVLVYEGSENTITGNTITDNEDGVYLYISSSNTVAENTIKHNINGVFLDCSSSNTIAENTIKDNNNGVYCQYSEFNIVTENTIKDNICGIVLGYSNNNDIYKNTIKDNSDCGILIAGSSNYNSVTENIIKKNINSGVYLIWGAHHNTISKNTIKDNEDLGVGLWMSDSNTISENIITNNYGGVGLYGNSNHNTVSENTIKDNDQGVYSAVVFGNKFYHNNFIDNTIQAVDEISTGVWDNGYPSGGNYWSDHLGIDEYSGLNQNEPGSDGISDISYMGTYFEDRYPLMTPWMPN